MSTYRRNLAGTGLATAVTAVVGSMATDPSSDWYLALDKPDWQPPSWAFPVAWTALYAAMAHASALTLTADDAVNEARATKRALAVNLGLNAGWSFLFFRSHNLPLAAGEAAALAVSSAGLARRAWRVNRRAGWLLVPYAAWTTFATALTIEIARRNG